MSSYDGYGNGYTDGSGGKVNRIFIDTWKENFAEYQKKHIMVLDKD